MEDRNRQKRRSPRGPLTALVGLSVGAALLAFAFGHDLVVRGTESMAASLGQAGTVAGLAVSSLPATALLLLVWRKSRKEITERLRAEAELRRSQGRYETILEQIPAIVYMDALGGPARTTYINRQIETILGFTVAEWLADENLWVERLHPDDRGRVVAESDRTAASGEAFRAEYRMISRDARVVWISEEAVEIGDDEGRPLYWQGVMYDITERKRADALLAHQTLVLERIVAGDSLPDVLEELCRGLARQFPTIQCAILVVGEDGTNLRVAAASDLPPEVRESLDRVPVGSLFRDDQPGAHAVAEQSPAFERGHSEVVMSEGAAIRWSIPFLSGRGAVLGAFVVCYPQSWHPTLLSLEPIMQSVDLARIAIEHRKTADQLMQTSAKYRALVEQTPAIVYIDALDGPSTTLYISPQSERVLGFTPDEWLGDPDLWVRQLHPEDQDRVLAQDAHCSAAGEPFVSEYRMSAKDGRVVWLHDQAVLVRDETGQPLHWQGVLHDITERKRSEEELRRALEVERESVNRLRELDELKDAFLQAVSHELRTPLAKILGISMTLEQQRPRLSSDEIDSLVPGLTGAARRLDTLVSDLLDLEHLARGGLEAERHVVDIAAIVRDAVGRSESLSGRRVHLATDSVLLAVDVDKVERIAQNLLSNVAKHTLQDVQVWVRLQPWADGALIIVEDDGPGVPEDLKDKIFEPFRHGPTPSSHSPGTGIGLSLVARFAQLHGGRAWVEDREGGGASFRVFLPSSSGAPPLHSLGDGIPPAPWEETRAGSLDH